MGMGPGVSAHGGPGQHRTFLQDPVLRPSTVQLMKPRPGTGAWAGLPLSSFPPGKTPSLPVPEGPLMLADGQTEARSEVFPVPLLLRPNPPYSGLLLPWPEPALSPLLIRGKCFQSRKGDEIFTEIFTDKWLLAEGLGTDRTGSTERRGWHRWPTLPSRPSPREGRGAQLA